MPLTLNRVGMLITTTGQGTITADTLLSSLLLTPDEAGAADGESYYWLLVDGNNFELFEGTWLQSGEFITRDTVLVSKISGVAGTTKLDLSGSAQLRSVNPADLINLAARQGRQEIYIDASAITSRTTSGAEVASATESTTNKIMQEGLDYDPSSIEYGQFRWLTPKQWDGGTVTFAPVWSHDTAATNYGVSWGLQAVAVGNDGAVDAAFGTAQYSNDVGGTTRDLYVGPESAAITIAGSPVAGDWVVFQVLRKADDGTNDTLAVDARLHGIVLKITTDKGNDE